MAHFVYNSGQEGGVVSTVNIGSLITASVTSRHTSVIFKMAGKFLILYVAKDVNFPNVWIHLLPSSMRQSFWKITWKYSRCGSVGKRLKSITWGKERYREVSINWHSLYDRLSLSGNVRGGVAISWSQNRRIGIWYIELNVRRVSASQSA